MKTQEFLVLFFVYATSKKDGIYYSKLLKRIENCLETYDREKLDLQIEVFFKEGTIISLGYDLTFDKNKEDRECILVLTKKGEQLYKALYPRYKSFLNQL